MVRLPGNHKAQLLEPIASFPTPSAYLKRHRSRAGSCQPVTLVHRMSQSDNQTPERRSDHAVRMAVDSIQSRFLDRVADRVARGLSLRELSEELIIETLKIAEADYGCVLRPDEDGKLVLDASVIIGKDNTVRRLSENIIQEKPDAAMQDVIDMLKPTFSNDLSKSQLLNLPASHPPIKCFAICPLHEEGLLKTLVLIANAKQGFDLVLVKRLQAMLDAFVRVHINSIVNRGINHVISGIGDTSQHLLNLLESSFNAVLTVDESLTITAFNPASERLFKVDTITALGASLELFLQSDVLDQIRSQAADYNYSLRADDLRPYRINEASVISSDAQLIAVELVVFHTRISNRVYTSLIVNDISGRLLTAEALQSTANQYSTLMQLAPVGILKLDEQWLCEYANEMWCGLSSRNQESNLGSGWIDAIHDEYQPQLLMDMRHSLIRGHTYRDVIKLNSTNDKTVWASISATALINNLNKLTGSLVVVMDITERYEAEQRFKQIAHHDPLTGLPNRTRFLEHLHRLLDQRSTYGIVCLLFIDLDGFKAVNDTLGHDAGDELLQQVAERLRQTVRKEDTVSRLGGDEFTVTLRTLEQEGDVTDIADAIVHAIKQPFLLKQEEVYVSASIGISMATGRHTGSPPDANSLIKQADIALYRAKLSGRSRHVFFTPELDQAQRDRSLLITSLRRAVDRQDFELFYQPQLLIKQNRLLGFEALLRWPQENGEYISPGEFIDVLEETGLIGELGEWAIAQACGQHRIWLRRRLIGPATTMSVNVSARQLSTPHFAKRVASILERQSMRPDNLILEITESALVQTIETNIINEIKALGVQISLDDFGTGYSSLSYLSQLPLDHLKIDRSFIADIEHHPHALAVVKSIIALAKTLGIRVIAEGVEKGSELPLLANEGCEGYQGFYFSEALPPRTMAAKMASLVPVRLSHYANFIDVG